MEGVALFEARRGEIDAVLLDMSMPRMGGEEAFRRMRALDPGVRVVLTSGYNEQHATSRLVGKGLAGFVQKPYRPQELVRALKEAIASRPG